ncbi:MAG: hypothetical protein IK052_05740 [Bacteroidales bacterium]|nr:hypothetical protein [Bacteroidales bacterium]
MKRLLLTAVFVSVIGFSASAQPYQLYSYNGDIQLRHRTGQSLAPVLDVGLEASDLVSVPAGGSVSILDQRKKKVSCYGACEDLSVKQIISNSRANFLGRISSMIKGVADEDRAYVSHKGDDPVPEFLFAMDQASYAPAYRLSLEVIDYDSGASVNRVSTGQRIYFRVTNHEEMPLCIGILWKDSVGNRTDCLESEPRYVIIPAGSTVDLKNDVMEGAPPLGTDTVCLFASEEFFTLEALPYADKPAASTGVKIGFTARNIVIR